MTEYIMASTPAPPAEPIQGDMWYDQDNGHVYVFMGTHWIQGTGAPATMVPDKILGSELLYEDEIAELEGVKT